MLRSNSAKNLKIRSLSISLNIKKIIIKINKPLYKTALLYIRCLLVHYYRSIKFELNGTSLHTITILSGKVIIGLSHFNSS